MSMSVQILLLVVWQLLLGAGLNLLTVPEHLMREEEGQSLRRDL